MFGNITFSSNQEKLLDKEFIKHFRDCPIPDSEIISNLGLFLNSKNLSRILFMDHIYKQILDVHGSVIEFGCRWGQNTALFSSLRGIYEPFNRQRKIIAFDTFEGFPSISAKDGNSVLMKKGVDAVTENYFEYLNKLIELQEQYNPINHIKKYELIKGNAIVELEKYLDTNPETIVALVYFDFDIYEPTKKCFELIKKRLIKGSVLVFDELNDHDSPGETIALMETIGLNNVRLKRYRYTSRVSYFVIE